LFFALATSWSYLWLVLKGITSPDRFDKARLPVLPLDFSVQALICDGPVVRKIRTSQGDFSNGITSVATVLLTRVPPMVWSSAHGEVEISMSGALHLQQLTLDCSEIVILLRNVPAIFVVLAMRKEMLSTMANYPDNPKQMEWIGASTIAIETYTRIRRFWR
jgi:hypothetical protein